MSAFWRKAAPSRGESGCKGGREAGGKLPRNFYFPLRPMLKSSLSGATWSGPSRGGKKPMNMIRKFILAAAATAVATSFLPSSSFAKKSHKVKEPPCSAGQACTDKPDKVSNFTGWVTVKRCSYDGKGKMYQDVFPCYTPGGACPVATCKSKKKK
jgi:hypothetical protein